MSSVGLSRQIYVSSQETNTPSQFSSAFENGEILSANYSLQEGTNKTAVSQWWENNALVDKYSYNNTDTINVTFNGVFSSEVYLNLSVGNITLLNTTDAAADSNLALGYWTVNDGGFVISNTTSANASLAALHANDTFASFNSGVSLKRYGSIYFSTVFYNFTAGSQETYLVYDLDSGLLLEAITGFGNSKLAITLSAVAGSYFDTKYLFSPSEDTIESIQYSLLEETNKTSINQWWTGSEAQNYTFSNTSSVNVTFERITDGNFYINISLGDLTLNNITDSSADSALVLGYWKASEGGFVVGNLSLLNDSLNLLLSEKTLMNYSSTLQEKEYGNYKFNVVSYNFTDSFGQKTYLVYDVGSGLLLDLDTSFGNFRLAMSADVFSGSYFEERRILETSSSSSLSSSTDSTVSDTPFSLLFFFFALLLCPLFLRFSSFSKLSRKKNNES